MNFHKKPPRPIDRGWAWIIMISSYLIMLIANGFGRSLSVFLPDILDHYNKPATVTTLAFGVGDIAWSLTNIAMPVLLIPRFSVRTLALWGAFFQCFAVIALAYSPNIIMFNCLFAVFGCAGGLMIVTSLIHLGHYFKKRLSFASAVAQIGSSTATVLAPRLALFLKDTYGYQGALLVIGGISFHLVAAAMLLWPVSMFAETIDEKEVLGNNSKNYIQKLEEADAVQMAIRINHQEEGEEDEEINEKSKFLHSLDLKTKQINELNSSSDLTMTKYTDIIKGRVEVESNEDFKNTELIPASGTSITRSSQSNHNKLPTLCLHLPELPLDLKVSKQRDTYTQNGHCIYYPNDASQIDLNATNKETHKPSGSNHNEVGTPVVTSERCCSVQKIKAYLSSSVLLNPVAVMLIVAGGLSTPGGNMYLPVLGLENGLSPDEVSWMLTITGISDILGKLAIGYFADLGYVRPIRIACITQFTLGMVCQFTTFYKGFGRIASMAVVFGMMNGAIQSLLASMVVESLGLTYLAEVTSVFYLSTGVCTFALNVSVGAIKDATGSFFGGFNLLGGMHLTSCAILTFEALFVICRDKFSKHAKSSH
ncbi:hypothetical protein BsWGS_23280 [Bradybaena similaris]